MEQKVKHKRHMGCRGFMPPVPPVLSEKGAQRGRKGARGNAGEPLTSEMIADEMEIPLVRVRSIVDKLENLKTFICRSDGNGMDGVYPLSPDNTGFRMTLSSGEKFFAA